MAIAQYSELYWYPSGVLAVGATARIFPKNSNILAPIFANIGGTIPKANPAVVDGTGTLSFFAEEGEYWVHIDSESILIRVGPDPAFMPVSGGTFTGPVSFTVGSSVVPVQGALSGALSTGVVSGGQLNINAGNPGLLDIEAADSYLIDHTTTPGFPAVTHLQTPTQTVAMDAGALARTVTWWLFDSAGNVVQQANKPDASQRRTHVMLGVTSQVGGVIVLAQTLPVILQNQADQFVDLLESLGAFNREGNTITPNGANLQINQSAGRVFARAFGHFVNDLPTNNPHIVNTQAQTPCTFAYVTRSTTVLPAPTTFIDVTHFDSGGVVTLIGGGANQCAIHRVYLFANANPAQQLLIQYGQATYASIAAAVDAIGIEPFTENPFFIRGGGALVAHIIATRTATNLSDPTQARISIAGKFNAP